MHRLTVCYGHPTEPEQFDRYYREIHRPLAEKLPGLKEFRFGSCESIEGDDASDPPPHYLVAELGFESSAHLYAALMSPEGRAAAEDLENFADGGVTLFVQRDLP